MNASVSDESKFDDSMDSKSKKMVYRAFPAIVKNVDVVSISGTLKNGETCEDSSQRESDDGQGLQVAYNQLYKECVNSKKNAWNLLKRLIMVEEEKCMAS